MDYKRLYKLQDSILERIGGKLNNMYLTGGTALGRFYLDHRYSDDLDFFANSDPDFDKKVAKIKEQIELHFELPLDKRIVTSEFHRYWVRDDDVELKIEFVNDVKFYAGTVRKVHGIPIDNPGNILANKLTAITGRDEPKDMFDVIALSLSYSFDWDVIFDMSLQKANLSEAEVAKCLDSFNTVGFTDNLWLKQSINLNQWQDYLNVISKDFLLARTNSLGLGKQPILAVDPKRID